MKMNPIDKFTRWYNDEQNISQVKMPSACCISTIGTDGFPNARFVSLKDMLENRFIVTGSLTSRKGIEINASNKVALTFWWPETERQVRIQGYAKLLPPHLADKYFTARSRESQIVSVISEAGQPIQNPEALHEKYKAIETSFANKPLPRPEKWGGYSIDPFRIEFLEFKPNRFHDRVLYELVNEEWTVMQLQP
jgi:pyridoxamine 5'-phosphate oxidase